MQITILSIKKHLHITKIQNDSVDVGTKTYGNAFQPSNILVYK